MTTKILVSDPLSDEGLEILKQSGFPVDVKPGLTEDESGGIISRGSRVKLPHEVDGVAFCAADAAAEELRGRVNPERPLGSQVERAAH